jgi:DNA polymerase family A
MGLINSTYEHELAYYFHLIDGRGILLDRKKLNDLRKKVYDRLDVLCSSTSSIINIPVYVGSDNGTGRGSGLNLNSPSKLLDTLKSLGFTLPKVRKKNKDTHEIEYKESTGVLVLQKTLANPDLWPTTPGFDAIGLLKNLLELSELKKFKTSYVNAKLHNHVFYSCYNVAATVTGRRGSSKHTFNIGGNAQNFPKYSELAALWRKAMIARPGRIYFFVDQISAEDWPVQALAENHSALDEMRKGVNRHYKFANLIFGTPIDALKQGRKNGDHECEMQYFLGKKARHANNYGMRGQRLSEQLAEEGHSVSKQVCDIILQKVNNADPNVDAVFHKYIQDTIFQSKFLVCPLGRERQFFGLRSGDKNYEILNEAYSYIPQETVGDNTGLAIVDIFRDTNCDNFINQDGHDSLAQELPDTESDVLKAFRYTKKAFDRNITFHNGITINIPIEGEFGYNWKETVKIENFSEDGVIEAYRKVKELREKEKDLQNEGAQETLAG